MMGMRPCKYIAGISNFPDHMSLLVVILLQVCQETIISSIMKVFVLAIKINLRYQQCRVKRVAKVGIMV